MNERKRIKELERKLEGADKKIYELEKVIKEKGQEIDNGDYVVETLQDLLNDSRENEKTPYTKEFPYEMQLDVMKCDILMENRDKFSLEDIDKMIGSLRLVRKSG